MAALTFDDIPSNSGGAITFDDINEQPVARPVDFSKIEEPSFIDRAALEADKVISGLTSGLPDWLPSRQDVVDVAAGMSEMGGLLKGADRFKNVATESGYRTAGRVLDPVATAVGIKGAQIAQQLPKLGAALETVTPLAARVRPVLDKITGAAATPFGQSVVGGTGAGAAVGALHGDPLEGAAFGAGIGTVAYPLAWLGGKAADLAANIKAGAEGEVINYLDKLLGGNKQAVLDTVRNLKALVSGERPTTGMAATIDPEKALALKSLEIQARGMSPELFIASDEAGQAARRAGIDAISAPGARPSAEMGGRVPRSKAEAQRDAIVGKMYQQADKELVNADEQLMGALSGDLIQPMVRKADTVLDQILTNQKNVGANLTRQGIHGGAYSPAQSAAPYWAMQPTTPAQITYPKVSIGAIRDIRGQLDKRINILDKKATSKADFDELYALSDSRKIIDAWLKERSPLLSNADATFNMLRPVQEQAQVGEYLGNVLTSPTGQENISGFLSAMRNQARTLRGADVKGEQLSQVMSPTQMRWLDQAKASAERKAAYEALPATRESLPALRSALENLEEMTPALLRWAVTLVRKGLELKGKATTVEAQMILNRAAADPRLMAKLLDAELPKNRASLANAIAKHMKAIPPGLGTSEAVRQQQ